VDIWAVRKARVRIIELRNDLRDVIDEIGKALEEVYANPQSSSSSSTQQQQEPEIQGVGAQEEQEQLVPFARVESVASGSPAAEAGLQRDDLVLKFGNLVKSSFDPPSSLTPLAALVSRNENVRLVLILTGLS
jgi:26S proteasome non-ATPase regulatory subunit 9